MCNLTESAIFLIQIKKTILMNMWVVYYECVIYEFHAIINHESIIIELKLFIPFEKGDLQNNSPRLD